MVAEAPKGGDGGEDKDMTVEKNDDEKDRDLDLALPNDDEDIHKRHQRRPEHEGSHLYHNNNDTRSLTSSQLLKLNRSIDSNEQLIPQSPSSNHIPFVDGKYVSIDQMNERDESNYYKANAYLNTDEFIDEGKVLNSSLLFGKAGELLTSGNRHVEDRNKP